MYYFSKTVRGYSHIKNKKVCQDFSSFYHDEERTIVTCCDGHGGDLYIRSQLGSKFACESIMNVFKSVTLYDSGRNLNQEYLDNLRLRILCEWNRLVESHYSTHPIRKREVEKLDEDNRLKLKLNPEKAYGTTLIGAMKLGSKLIVVHLGDGESLFLKKGEIESVFPEQEDDPVANVTYSMCAEDAYQHLQIRVVDYAAYDGVLLCSDGVVNPYQNYPNFRENMVKPLVSELIKTNQYKGIESYLYRLGTKLGIGDDVSLSFIIKDNLRLKYYGKKDE